MCISNAYFLYYSAELRATYHPLVYVSLENRDPASLFLMMLSPEPESST